MILATYQPKVVDKSKAFAHKGHRAISEYLGFEPIWCFAANSMQEFFRNSVMAAPNCPEVLYIFETDDFTPIDVVLWNQLLFKNKSNEDFSESDLAACFKIEDAKYCEYLVKEIPDSLLCEKIVLHDFLFYTQLHVDFGEAEDNAFSMFMNNLRAQAADFVESSLANSRITSSGSMIEARHFMRLRIEKNAFETFMSPYIMTAIIPGQSLSHALCYHPNLYSNIQQVLSLLLVANYNGETLPTYGRQDDILSLLDSCFVPVAPWGDRKVGPNEPCPCGSGKKYKKCCRGKYYEG